MNRTKIEWCDYTWNPITGCTYGCSYCYAKKITERFPDRYPFGFDPTFWPDRLLEPSKLKKPSRIFTCSMGDFWDPAISDEERAKIFNTILNCQQHRFLILTKRPEKIHPPQALWALPNLWMGVTVDLPGMEWRIDSLLQAYRNIGITCWHPFVSFEPLLGEINPDLACIEWVIIGAQTNPRAQPKQEWVMKIIEQADDCCIPVFEKDNLETAIRKEYPKDLNHLGW